MNFIAQKVNVQYVFAGQITNYETGKKEGSVTATLVSGGRTISTAMTATNGKYTLTANMPAQSNFQIVFSKPGFVSKRVAYNFSTMNTDRLKEGEKLTPTEDLSLELFTVKPGVDFSFLEREPVATFGLNADNLQPALDIESMQRIKQKIEGLLANPTPQPDNADANYNSAIKSGDNLFGQKKYEEALKQYENAAGIKPKEFYPQKKIAEIDALLKAKKNEMAAESETDKQYKNLIAAADNFRDNKQYSEAIAKYNTALRVKYEQYPKDEIKKIEAIIAEARKEEREDKSYQEAIAAADVALNAKNYKTAKERYEAAIAIKSDEQYPKDQLQLVEKELKKIADEEAKQKKYDETIAAADLLFAGSKFVEAKAKYNEALTIIPTESYPVDKIKSCDDMIAKNAKAIKDAEDIKRLFEEGQKLIDEKSYTNAKGKYKEILQIDPKTNLAQVKLDEIDRLIKADEDAKNAEKIIAGYIAEGDAAVKEEKYDIAKMKYGAALEVREDPALREKYNALLSKIANKQAKVLVDQKFEESMKAAKALLDADKLEEARRAYQAAANLDESRTEPKMRIAEIDAKLVKISEADKAYRAIIDKGDALMKEEKYLAAIDEYNKALLIRPSDKEPKEKADEAERLERAKGDVANEQFEKIISVSRSKIEEGDYEKAAELLNRAISLRSPERKSDRRPEQMLEEIEKLKRIDISYKEKIQEAEKFAAEKKFDKAITKFEEAAVLKANEDLPAKRIEELKKAQSEFLGAAQKEILFNESFQKGNAAKAAKTYELALENFQKALSYKPDHQATKDQIDEIKQIIEERKLADENSKNQRERMAALLKNADDLFNLGDWGEAKTAYQKIIAIDKDQAHANARIKECDLRLSEEKNKLANEEYKALIASADNNFEKKDFLRSKELFEKASSMRPKDAYPIKRLAEIDLLLNPVIVSSSSLEPLGDVYVGDDGEADLMQADLDRKNEKNGKFSEVLNEANKQRENYNNVEKRENLETKDAIVNTQIKGEKEATLAKEQVQRKNEFLTQIKKHDIDVNEQNALYEKSDNYQAQEKVNYIQQNVAQTSEIQGQAYKLNAQKVQDNASRLNSMNDSKSLSHQDYQIQSGKALTKMSIEAQEAMSDEESRLAMQADLELKKSSAQDLSLQMSKDEFSSTRQTTVGLNELRDKSEKKSLSEVQKVAVNTEKIKAVESKMQDEGRKAYNHEMEIYLETKEAINTQEKVGIRKADEADNKTDLNNLNIKSKRIQAEQSNITQGNNERIDNQNSQADLDVIKAKGTQISSDYGAKQYDNSQTLKVKTDATVAANEALEQKADKKNLESRGNIETLISERAERDNKTIDKQLKNAKMVDEVYSVAATQAQDNAKRTQDNQREVTDALNKVDDELKISKPRNTLGDEFPEGVTEEKFSQKGPDGKLSKIITRRIVVIDGHGDVYIRTQMKGVTTYKKNNESISEYVWQRETQNSSLVRH
jgi:tetratricopeptide (TPR) repeat protein